MAKELLKLLTEHGIEHDFNMTKIKPYTKPKISKGKRNYIYYSFVDPESGKMTRQDNIYLKAHRLFPDKRERIKYLSSYRDLLEDLLKDGYSPYREKMDIKSKLKSVEYAFDYALSIKKAHVAESTYKSYKSKVKLFTQWLKKEHFEMIDIKAINKSVGLQYLKTVLIKTSPRNHNNTLTDLSAIFSLLAAEDFIETNFFVSIKKIKTTSQRDKTFSKNEMISIRDSLKNERALLMLINLMYYCLWRSSEVVRLKVSDISLENRRITDRTKTNAYKTKIIPDIIFDDLKEYIEEFPNRKDDDLLITPKGIGPWISGELDRQKHFGKKFKVKTKELDIKGKYSLNSIRHTAATEIFISLRKDFGFKEALDKFMLISGHESIKGALNYIHQLDAEVPEEYSDLFN